MKYLISALLLTFIFSKPIHAQESLYLSPGINICYTSKGSFMLGWKLSVGYISNENSYFNVTLGNKTMLGSNPPEPLKLMFVELQAGSFGKNYPASAGGGIGLAFLKNNTCPKITAFAGSGFFIEASYVFKENLLLTGAELVLPVPLVRGLRNLSVGG